MTHVLTLLVLLVSSLTMSWSEERFVNPTTYPGTIKLACVGDSITQGVGAGTEPGKSWPDQIQRLLGSKWQVRNFGVSGATLMNKGDKPYQKTDAFPKALAFQPDIVVITLGTNDTKPHNWQHQATFVPDYVDLIGKFAALPSKPRIFISFPPYIAGKGNFGISEEVTLQQFPHIYNVAKMTGATIIDVHHSLLHKDHLIPDRVHPNTAGLGEIAAAVYEAMLGKPIPSAAQ